MRGCQRKIIMLRGTDSEIFDEAYFLLRKDFDRERQDVHAGGSGCGCSAAVFCSLIMRGFSEGKWAKVLFAPTGALMSPTSTQQGSSIPGICHALAIEKYLPD